ncbi:MAG TPA: HAD family hydrolase [Candidatus Levilactobacillus faecigallinarum]|uniref:HAD family hydrolase n=1 Tax=Candidatus Levilactobacillus faecigallinarum TaxID=2838638 RepID=A0A9D1U3Q0_9LACO|nr:HAD family hydrolase [Candidatus Levilactobacillus faecigallinarum]
MKSFIFDIDGTLLDTEAMYMTSLQAILHERGIEKSYAELATTFGIPSKDALLRLKIPAWEDVLALWGPRTQDYRDTVAIYAGVTAALADLKARGAQLAIMTSKRQFEYDRDVVSLGLDQYFSQAIVAEDVANGKPAPDGILLAMQRLGSTSADTVYVGDTIYDQEAAHAAGVAFGFAAWNGKRPDDLQPDVSFLTPAAMLKLL